MTSLNSGVQWLKASYEQAAREGLWKTRYFVSGIFECRSTVLTVDETIVLRESK